MRVLWALLACSQVFAQYSAPSQVFSNLFGGASGSDAATALAVDSDGNAAVLGTTNSPDFPVTSNAYQPRLAQLPLASVTGRGVTYPPISAVDVTALGASSDNSFVYAGSSSGFFRSADGGQTWARQSSSLIGAISVAVDGGSDTTVYACLYGVVGPTIIPGIYKSTDGGVTWSFKTSLCRGPLLTPAQLPGVVYAAYGGLYRSTDGGATWSGNLAPHNYNTFATALAPSDPNVLYTVPSDGLLYRSSDGGKTWTAPGGAFTAYPNSNASLYVGALAVDPQDENTVWAVNFAGTLWKSTDGGASFAIVQQTGQNSQGPTYLSIDPSGKNIVAGRMMSFDGGSTWSSRPSVGYRTALALPQSILLGTSAEGANFLAKWSSDGRTMLFSTFLTLTSNGSGQPPQVASDSAGDTWVASNMLMKFDPSGNLLFSKSLGQLATHAIALDPAGNVYLAAANYTVATTCTVPAAQNGSIPIVMKFDSQGNSIYTNPVTELCMGDVKGLAVDGSGTVYLVGDTFSTSLATTPAAVQPVPVAPSPDSPYPTGSGFLAVLSPGGDRVTYLSYIGGNYSTAAGVAVDPSGNVFVSGRTLASGLPFMPTASFGACTEETASVASLAYVMKLNPSSALPAWLTELAGGCAQGWLETTNLAVDTGGNVWAGGTTNSGQFPTIAPLEVEGYHLAFLSEISPDGTQLLFSSYTPGKFALGPDRTLYLAGAAYPNPAKISVQVYGSAGQTSAEIEKYALDGTQSAVIDSISSINPPAPDADTRFLTIAPGELVKITGRGLGPSTAAGAQLDANGRVASQLAGTRVLFDGVPAPLISVQEASVTCVAPFEIGSRTSTRIEIERNGTAPPDGVVIGVTPEAFYASVLAVLNADWTLNSQSNPSRAGQPVILYVTGFGDTSPSVPDGTVYQPPLPVPLYFPSPYQSPPFYVGPAPGMVAGIWQVNTVPMPQPNSSNPVMVSLDSSFTIDGYHPVASASVWVAP